MGMFFMTEEQNIMKVRENSIFLSIKKFSHRDTREASQLLANLIKSLFKLRREIFELPLS